MNKPTICAECVHHIPHYATWGCMYIDQCASNPVGTNYVTGKPILANCETKNTIGECEEFTPKAGTA